MVAYYISHPWRDGGLNRAVEVPPEVEADRARRANGARSGAAAVMGDPPDGYQRTELRYVPSPSINPTLGIGVVTRLRPVQTSNLRLTKISLPRISILEGSPP